MKMRKAMRTRAVPAGNPLTTRTFVPGVTSCLIAKHACGSWLVWGGEPHLYPSNFSSAKKPTRGAEWLLRHRSRCFTSVSTRVIHLTDSARAKRVDLLFLRCL